MRDNDLPDRDVTAEDLYVQKHLDEHDPAALDEAIEAAMGARRPQLAIRLASLLGEPSEAAAKALRATRLVLIRNDSPEVELADDEDPSDGRRRVRRMLDRHRSGSSGGPFPSGRDRRR